VDAFFALVAAVVGTVFAFELLVSWKARRRLHAEVWSMAFGAYALGSWALFVGLLMGWTSLSFRNFYFFGAIANIPLLAAGSIALVVSERAARRFLTPTMLWVVLGFFATFLAPFIEVLPVDTVPEGSEVFGFTFALEAMTLPGPRLFAAVSGAVGSVVIVGLSLISVLRSLRSNRRLALANVLIIAGAIVPALGGTLTALGDSTALALSLGVGIILLWIGYRMATSARHPAKRDDAEVWEIDLQSL